MTGLSLNEKIMKKSTNDDILGKGQRPKYRKSEVSENKVKAQKRNDTRGTLKSIANTHNARDR